MAGGSRPERIAMIQKAGPLFMRAFLDLLFGRKRPAPTTTTYEPVNPERSDPTRIKESRQSEF